MSSQGAQIIQGVLFGTRNGLLGTGTIASDQNNQLRTGVSLAQFYKSIKTGKKIGNQMIQKYSTKALNFLNGVAENDKVMGKVLKTVDFASNNVNNLIVVSSGVRVLTAKDKQSECIAQAGNIAGMFAVEGWMKKNLAKYIDKLPLHSKMKPVVEGILFVLGSITGSTVCYNIGKKVAAKLKKSNEEYQTQQVQNNLPQKISFKA